MGHYLFVEKNGELVDCFPFCSDWCHRQYCSAYGVKYEGWNGCHENPDYSETCSYCGVVMDVVKCDSCGVDTPSTGYCRNDDGFNVPVGLCDSCMAIWDRACAESVSDSASRLFWVDERVKNCQDLIDQNDPHLPAELLYVLGVVEEFAELLRVHYVGGES